MEPTSRGRGRTVMFIDNSYVFSGMRSAGWRISWEKLLNRIEEDGEIWQTHFFASEHVPPKENQRNFFNMLSYNLDFELHLTSTRSREVRFESTNETRTIFFDKGLDVQLVTWLMILLRNQAFDTLVLLSGDGDLCEAVREVKRTGCKVEVVGWRNSVARELNDLSSRRPVLFLDDIREEIEKDEDHQL